MIINKKYIYIYIYILVYSCAYTCTEKVDMILKWILSWSWSGPKFASQFISQLLSQVWSQLWLRCAGEAIAAYLALPKGGKLSHYPRVESYHNFYHKFDHNCALGVQGKLSGGGTWHYPRVEAIQGWATWGAQSFPRPAETSVKYQVKALSKGQLASEGTIPRLANISKIPSEGTIPGLANITKIPSEGTIQGLANLSQG